MASVLTRTLYYFSLGHGLGQHYSFFIILQTCEYLVRISVEQSDKSHPLLFVVLESHHITFQLFRSDLCHFRMFAWNCIINRFLFFLFIFFRHRNHHSRTAAVTIYSASGTPSLYIETINQSLIHIVRQIHRYTDRMVDPLLYSTLHLDFHQPVHVVCRGLIIRRAGHKSINLFLGIFLFGIYTVCLHPCNELVMVYNVFLERVSHLVHKVDMHISIIRIHFPTTFVHRHEHRLYTTRGLCHQARGTSRCYSQTGYISTTIFRHILIKLRIGILQAHYERIVCLTCSIINSESTTLASHCHRRAIGSKRQTAMHLHRKIRSLLCSITQPHCGYHVTLGRYANTRTASHAALTLDFLPQMVFCLFHFIALKVCFNL